METLKTVIILFFVAAAANAKCCPRPKDFHVCPDGSGCLPISDCFCCTQCGSCNIFCCNCDCDCRGLPMTKEAVRLKPLNVSARSTPERVVQSPSMSSRAMVTHCHTRGSCKFCSMPVTSTRMEKFHLKNLIRMQRSKSKVNCERRICSYSGN